MQIILISVTKLLDLEWVSAEGIFEVDIVGNVPVAILHVLHTVMRMVAAVLDLQIGGMMRLVMLVGIVMGLVHVVFIAFGLMEGLRLVQVSVIGRLLKVRIGMRGLVGRLQVGADVVRRVLGMIGLVVRPEIRLGMAWMLGMRRLIVGAKIRLRVAWVLGMLRLIMGSKVWLGMTWMLRVGRLIVRPKVGFEGGVLGRMLRMIGWLQVGLDVGLVRGAEGRLEAVTEVRLEGMFSRRLGLFVVWLAVRRSVTEAGPGNFAAEQETPVSESASWRLDESESGRGIAVGEVVEGGSGGGEGGDDVADAAESLAVVEAGRRAYCNLPLDHHVFLFRCPHFLGRQDISLARQMVGQVDVFEEVRLVVQIVV